MRRNVASRATPRWGAVAAVLALVAVIQLVTTLSDDDSGTVRIAIETPSIAPGVKPGTTVILHGAAVGAVSSLQRTQSDSISMDVALDAGKIGGLTEDFAIDFRPENYFGVTALNVIPESSGSPLENGARLIRPSAADYTMSTMIERGSIVTTGSLSQDMVDIVEKMLKYTDGLTPLIRSGLVFADVVAKTQRALPAELLAQADDIVETLPGFFGQTVDGATVIFEGEYNRQPDGTLGPNTEVLDKSDAGLALGSGSLFSAAGTLLRSHSTELTPAVDIVRMFAEPVPGMVGDGALGPRLRRTVRALTDALGGGGANPTVRLKIIVDDLPGLAAPLGLGGLTGEVLGR